MLFNQGGLFSIKCLYQVNFMTIGSPKKPRIWTLQGYMLLVFNTHFKKDDVNIFIHLRKHYTECTYTSCTFVRR